MLNISKWKYLFVALVCFVSAMYALPNVMTENMREWVEKEGHDFIPNKTVNLGLDLRGGAHLLMEVAIGDVMDRRLSSVEADLRRSLRKNAIRYSGLKAEKGVIKVTIRSEDKLDAARKILRNIDSSMNLEGDGTQFTLSYSQVARTKIVKETMEQTIEVIRRRVDATGTKEPTIQRQGDDRVIVQLPGLSDPKEILSLLEQTALLEFRMVDTTVTQSQIQSGRLPSSSELLPHRDEENGGLVAVKREVMVSGANLTSATQSFNQNNSPIVSFSFDSVGARKFCNVTRDNIGKPFAVVLDNKVISAPVIRSAICAGNGMIEGGFTIKSANELAVLLRAGALPAKLTVLEERTVGPGLGQDAIEAGEEAAVLGLLLVLGFMTLSYGRFGIYANIALLCNITMIFAALSLLGATLTLPGIAGIVLTIGMAVDANVLIFERIREEFKNGKGVFASVESGYANALSAIVDANVTTLIAALLLYSFGSGPVKGFAVTLGIGVLTSLFAAIMITRLIVVNYVRRKRPTTLNI